MSKPQVGEYWQYKFLGQIVTGRIVKIRLFGLLHLIHYRTRWTDTGELQNAYKWKIAFKAIERLE